VWICTDSSAPHNSWKSSTILGSGFEISSTSLVTTASALAGKGVGSEWKSVRHSPSLQNFVNIQLLVSTDSSGDRAWYIRQTNISWLGLQKSFRCVYCSKSRIPPLVVSYLWRKNYHPRKSTRWEYQLDTRNRGILYSVGPRLVVFCANAKDRVLPCWPSWSLRFWRTRIRHFWAVWDWNLCKCLGIIWRILLENLARHKCRLRR